MNKIKKIREPKKKTSVNLSIYYRQFILEQINTGRYSSASDVMTAALRLLEKQTIMLVNKKKQV